MIGIHVINLPIQKLHKKRAEKYFNIYCIYILILIWNRSGARYKKTKIN
jgi:hypothetical protein